MSRRPMRGHRTERDRQVRRVIIIEGSGNLVVLLVKVFVGVSTGSMAVLGDALHSLTDAANNVLAWIVIRIAEQPPDREHPYGHRKFETLAVFALATLLAVLAVQLTINAIQRHGSLITQDAVGLALMIVVLVVNAALSSWEAYWAARLDSDILRADARHTFADVMVTIAVIAGWQLSVAGYGWMDSVGAFMVAAVVFYLAFGLYRRAIPALVSRIAVEPEPLADAVLSVAGVRKVRRIRSRWEGSLRAVDMVVAVDPALSTRQSHEIADEIERILEERFGVEDSSIHIEPYT
jgi:cation diffusion facilitator family transporter